MSGTVEGARKAKAKILAREPDFYKRIGSIGGRNGTTGGFAYDREKAKTAGSKGGSIAKRGMRFEGEYNGIRSYTELYTGRLVQYRHNIGTGKYERIY